MRHHEFGSWSLFTQTLLLVREWKQCNNKLCDKQEHSQQQNPKRFKARFTFVPFIPFLDFFRSLEVYHLQFNYFNFYYLKLKTQNFVHFFLQWQLFNHESTSPVIKKINKWSSESIERFRNRISKSSAVYFEATHKNNSCYKGKLTTEMDISQALIEWKNAISNSFKYYLFTVQ